MIRGESQRVEHGVHAQAAVAAHQHRGRRLARIEFGAAWADVCSGATTLERLLSR